jgi:hypothetical protein
MRCAISSTARPSTTDVSSRLVSWSCSRPEPVQIVETAATFAIEWKGSYRINGSAFVYSDRDTGRVITILGYPIDKLVDIE